MPITKWFSCCAVLLWLQSMLQREASLMSVCFRCVYHSVKTVFMSVKVKPLAVIWGKFPQYSSTNTVMVDDLRRNFLMNPSNGIKVSCFRNVHTFYACQSKQNNYTSRQWEIEKLISYWTDGETDRKANKQTDSDRLLSDTRTERKTLAVKTDKQTNQQTDGEITSCASMAVQWRSGLAGIFTAD